MIQGGVPLSGEIAAAGNKNAALPILAACLLTEEDVVLRNVPRIRDTEAQIAILLERSASRSSGSATTSCGSAGRRRRTTEVDEELAARIRASFLLAGPLLARFGEARMPPPGGDTIGRRRLDPHLDAFRDLGAKVDGEPDDRAAGAAGGLKRLRDLHGRALGDGDRERAARRGADARARRRSPTPPASRTSRTSRGC